MPFRMAETAKASRAGGDRTRAALVDAGLRIFGEKGFAAASTREIAAAAKANIGSIAYHFGGKAGLRDACAERIVEAMRAVAGPVLEASPPVRSAAAAEAALGAILERMVGFLIVRQDAGPIAQFVLRELSQPTSALDIVYAGVFEPVHRRLCELWALAAGDEAGSERTMLAVFTMIGQVVYFRIGREAVKRRLGWPDIGRDHADAILAVVRANLAAALASRREGRP